MAEQIILIAGIAAALIFGIITIRRKATDARKWALAAFAGMLAYTFCNYMLPQIADTAAFVFLKEAALAAGGLSAGAFIMSVSSVAKVARNKNIYNGFIGISSVFAAAVLTIHMHTIGITEVNITGPGEDGLYTASYIAGPVYTGAAVGYGVILIIMSLYVTVSAHRVKHTAAVTKLSAVMSVVFSVFIVLSALSVIPSLIAEIALIAGDILQFALVMIADNDDIIDFAATNSLNAVNDGIIILNNRKKFLFANKTAKRLFIELSENNISKINEMLAGLPEKGTITRADHTYSISRSPYTDYTGRCDCTVISAQDITEQQLRTGRLAKEAAVDSITGVNSRSGVVEILKDTVAEENGTLIIVSFDGFKAINNAYGHEEANELLKAFGSMVRNNTNTDDVRGRFGGEKFVLFLRGCTNTGVISNLTMRLEEQAAAAVKKQFGDSINISLGVSAGAVLVPDAGRDLDTLIELAEAEQEKITNSGGHGYSVYGVGRKAENDMRAFTEEFAAFAVPETPADDNHTEEASEPANDSVSMEDLFITADENSDNT